MTDWVDILPLTALEPGDVTPVTVGTYRLAIHDTRDGVFITQAQCSHAGADLCDGYLDGHIIECPLHQGCFDVRDGKPLYAPATRPIRTFPVRIVDSRIQTQLP